MKNLNIQKLTSYFTYIINNLITGSPKLILDNANLFIFFYQILIAFLTLIFVISIFYRIPKNRCLKILANLIWFFSGFIIIFIIVSLIIFYFFYSFNFLYIYNIYQIGNSNNRTLTVFSECLNSYNESQIDPKYKEIDSVINNITFFTVRNSISQDYDLFNFNIILQTMRDYIQIYSDIFTAFADDTQKVKNSLEIFNEMIGNKKKFPFQVLLNCKNKINLQLVFEKTTCKEYYPLLDTSLDKINFFEGSYCLTFNDIKPEKMDEILQKYKLECNKYF